MSQSFGDMAFSPKGVIWVLSIFERIPLSRIEILSLERVKNFQAHGGVDGGILDL